MELNTPRWIIDDGPLNDLAARLTPADVALWPSGTLHVANATRDKARGDRLAMLGAGPLEIVAIEMGTAASDTLYGHLRDAVTDDKHLAEHEAIAWAMHVGRDAVFVAYDKGALVQALAELGRCRAAHACDLWLWLREQGYVNADQFDALCEKTRKSNHPEKRPLRTIDR